MKAGIHLDKNTETIQPPFIENRIIMTPGPVEADPRVLKAMHNPVIGQFDPAFLKLMDETMDMTRTVFKTKSRWAYAINGTARAGIEALMGSVIKEGDRVYVPIFGRFGHLMAEIAKRSKATVHTTEKDLGEVYDFDELKKEIDRFEPKVVSVVHGESSTGMMQPLEKLGTYCHEKGILLIVDAVATLGGAPFEMDAWHIDGAVTGSQKALAAPSGMALVAYNEKIEAIIQSRKQIEQGLDNHHVNEHYIPSNYLDLSQLQAYWSRERLNHHTEATNMLYAIHEALRLTLEEGLANRIERHRTNKQALMKGLRAMGLSLFGDPDRQTPTITCVKVPKSIGNEKVRRDLVEHYNIEMAPGFGPLKETVWRIGAIGYSSRKQNILIFLGALEAVLLSHGAEIEAGKAVQSALKHYQG